MSTNWPFSADYQSRINNWLNDQPYKILQSTRLIAEILQSERNLRGKDTFKLPKDRFLQERKDNHRINIGELSTILVSLERIKIIVICVFFPDTYLPGSHPAELLTDLTANVIQNRDIEVSVFTQGLDYLERRIKESPLQEDTSSCFWFDDKTFKLKRGDQSVASINFYPHKGETSDTYYLMYALVSELRVLGIRTSRGGGVWLTADIPRNKIIERIEKEQKIRINPERLKSTRGNLIKKIPEDYKRLIDIGYFKRSTEIYPIAIKLPL